MLSVFSDGSHGCMITKLASLSPRATTLADAELVELAERFKRAEAECGHLSRIADELDGRRVIDPPEALRLRDGDPELGLPSLAPDCFYGSREIEYMRLEWWFITARTDHEDGKSFTIAANYLVPSTSAQARADEVIAAHEKWIKRIRRKPNGYRAAAGASDNAFQLAQEIESQILEVPATTIEGLVAKAKCQKLTVGDVFARSTVDDLLAVAGVSA
jgi:hypothetical protein